jgi:hypothetical protein
LLSNDRLPTKEHLRATLSWTLLFLVLIEVAVSILVSCPANENAKPGRLVRYLNYGRSVEGKVRLMLGTEERGPNPKFELGWIGRYDLEPKTRGSDGHCFIALYGMSFTDNLGNALARSDELTIRRIVAPSAPPNWVYGAFQHDLDQGIRPNAAIFTVMSSGMSQLQCFTGMTARFDQPYPYTMPQYRVVGDRIESISPLIQTADEMRDSLEHQPDSWNSFCDQLQAHDPYFDRLLFFESGLDESVMFRLLRRGYAVRMRKRLEREFSSKHEDLRLLKLILVRFAEDCKQCGILPIVFFVDNLGSDGKLSAVLSDDLEASGIHILRSAEFAPPDNPETFLQDGHLQPAIDLLLAERVKSICRKRGEVENARPPTGPGVVKR